MRNKVPDPDIILLHAPSVYDFRTRPTMHGPISDVIPATPVFEMYPLGWVSIVGYLAQAGIHTRIINIAVKMLKNPSLDVEHLISKLRAKAIGFDLHWLAHAAGSLDLAAIVKKHHPDTPILLGGLSSTYYHQEIIDNHPHQHFKQFRCYSVAIQYQNDTKTNRKNPPNNKRPPKTNPKRHL